MDKILPFTVLLLAAAIGAANSQPTAFFKLAMQWPGSFCLAATCVPSNVTPLDYFTVHGLWPHDKGGKPVKGYSPTNKCLPQPPPALNSTLTSEIENRSMNYWPDLYDWKNRTANFKFWEHEWDKHGTCSPYKSDANTYFKKALDLRDEYDIVDILKNEGITQGTTTTKAQQYLDAIEKNQGAVGQNIVEMKCNKHSATKKLQLVEIRLCLDTSTTKFTSCGGANKFTGCVAGDTVLFPPV